MKKKLTLAILSQELFQFSLVTYLILLLAETIKEGFVSYFFNLNILLGVVLVSGVVMVLTHDERIEKLTKLTEKPKEKLSDWDYYYIGGITLGGALLVYYKTQDLGNISLLLTIITAVIIALLSYLIMTDRNDEKDI